MPLWHILASERPALFETLTSRLAAAQPERTDVTPDKLPVEIVGLLDQLTIALRGVDVGKAATLLPEAKSLAGELGRVGATQGRRIEEVVTDFLALHDAILDVARQKQQTISAEEHRALARGINRATASAVARYAEFRDHELARAHAEHFAFLAHELRTPLSNINMGVELMGEGGDAKILMPSIRRSVGRMRELIDNEIAHARLTSSSSLHIEPVALGPLLASIVDDLRIQATDRKIALELDAPAELEVCADVRLLRSICTNLVANAIKFTQPDERIDVIGHEADGDVVITVIDGCGGLPEGTAEVMFKPYHQSGRDRTGFGLGLAIIEEAVRLHSGSIRVDNRPGQGCTMTVRLPKSQVPIDVLPPVPS